MSTSPHATDAARRKRRVKPSLWRRLFAWGPFGLIVLLWFHSLLYEMGFDYFRAEDDAVWRYELISNAGHITFEYYKHDIDFAAYGASVPPPEYGFRHRLDPITGDISAAFPSHDWYHDKTIRGYTRTHIAIPHWWFATLATLWLAFLVWWRKLRAPVDCPQCGYDLRGSQGACPECGAVPQAKKV